MNPRGKITLLIFFLSVCATALVIHLSRMAPPKSRTPADLFDVVQRQVTAFRTRNIPSAYREVSSSFQQQWSLEDFSGMVRHDTRRVLNAERIEFGPWYRHGRRATVQVFFVQPDGSVLPCIYTLVSEGPGWKIEGARWIKGWPTGQRMRGIRS